jgi:hypothetical protein
LLLRDIAMQDLSLLLEIGFGKYLIGLFLGLTENNSTSMASTVEVDDVGNDGVAVVVGTVEGQVLNSLGSPDIGVLDEVDYFTVRREIFAGEVDDPGRDSCRKEQILCFSGAILSTIFENLLDVFLKALFQHFICLIEASYLQVGELDAPPLEQVNQSARGRNHDIASISNLAYLLVNVTATVHCDHIKISPHSQTVDLVANLYSQLNRPRTTSLVGNTIRNLTLPPSLNASSFRNLSMTGKEKARVFPEPVRSRAMTSLPLKICSKVSYWMGKNCLMPLSLRI